MTRKMKAAVEAIKAEAKRKSAYEAEMNAYYTWIDRASKKAELEVRQNAMAGLFPEMRLYYRAGELLLTSSQPEESFKDSGRVMPNNVAYGEISRWITKNSGDLAVFAPEGGR